MPYDDFTTGAWRGLNQDENPLSLQPGELRDCLNVTRYGENLGTRPGTERPGAGEDYETALDEANPIRGAFEFRESFDEGRHLVVMADHTDAPVTTAPLFHEDGARLPPGTPPTISADQDYIMSATMFQNLMWATQAPPGKTSVLTESIWTWDGNTANGPTTRALTDKASVSALFPKSIFSWGGYLLMNGLQQSAANRNASNNPMATRYCTFLADPTLDASWPDAKTIGFAAARPGTDSYGGNFTTGFAGYRDNLGDFMLILSHKRLFAVRRDATNEFIITDEIANGCVHQRAYVSLGIDSGDGVFVSGGRGAAVHSLRQSQAHGGVSETFLSHKIRPFMRTFNPNRIHHTCGVYDAERGVVIFAVTTGSNTGHDTLMVLDVADASNLTADTARWYLWRPQLATDVTINHLLYARDASNTFHVYAFTTAGDVIRFTTDIYSDIGNAYGIKIRTRDDPYGALSQSKTLGDVFVPIRSIGAVNASIRPIFDMGQRAGKVRTIPTKTTGGSVWGTGVWGTATWGSTEIHHTAKVDGRGSGSTIGFEITHTGADEKLEIGPIQHQVMPSGETENEAA